MKHCKITKTPSRILTLSSVHAATGDQVWMKLLFSQYTVELLLLNLSFLCHYTQRVQILPAYALRHGGILSRMHQQFDKTLPSFVAETCSLSVHLKVHLESNHLRMMTCTMYGGGFSLQKFSVDRRIFIFPPPSTKLQCS